jgi:hypothetical protein
MPKSEGFTCLDNPSTEKKNGLIQPDDFSIENDVMVH